MFHKLSSIRKGSIACLFTIALALAVEFPHGPQHWSSDLLTSMFSPKLETQHPDIAIVEVSYTSLESFTYVSPVDRGLIANLVHVIDAAGPKVIGLDFFFDRPTEPSKDAKLLQTLKEASAPMVIGFVSPSSLPKPQAEYQAKFLEQANRNIGHLYFEEVHGNPFTVSDAVARKLVVARQLGTADRGLAQAMSTMFKQPVGEDGDYIDWLKKPLDGSDTFLTLPAESLIGPAALDATLVEKLLKGKFVLVGVNFPDRDQHLTPLSVFSGRSPGVFVHAQILQQELKGTKILALDSSIVPAAMVILLAGALGGLLAYYGVGQKNHLAFEALTFFAMIAITVLLWIGKIVLPFSGMLIMFLAVYAGVHAAIPKETLNGGSHDA